MIDLNKQSRERLTELMINSAKKGNLANSALVIDTDNQIIMAAESWVVSSCDATAHSERMLVEQVCKLNLSYITAGLKMVSVVEPCLMCMSACSQAGYAEIGFIIPAEKFISEIPWMSDISGIDKYKVGESFNSPIQLTHLAQYQDQFEKVFIKAMKLEL